MTARPTDRRRRRPTTTTERPTTTDRLISGPTHRPTTTTDDDHRPTDDDRSTAQPTGRPTGDDDRPTTRTDRPTVPGPSTGPGSVEKRCRMKNQSLGNGRDVQGPRIEKTRHRRSGWDRSFIPIRFLTDPGPVERPWTPLRGPGGRPCGRRRGAALGASPPSASGLCPAASSASGVPSWRPVPLGPPRAAGGSRAVTMAMAVAMLFPVPQRGTATSPRQRLLDSCTREVDAPPM